MGELFRKVDHYDAEIARKEQFLHDLNKKLTLLKDQSAEAKKIDTEIFKKVRAIESDDDNCLKYINLRAETKQEIRRELEEQELILNPKSPGQ